MIPIPVSVSAILEPVSISPILRYGKKITITPLSPYLEVMEHTKHHLHNMSTLAAKPASHAGPKPKGLWDSKTSEFSACCLSNE